MVCDAVPKDCIKFHNVIKNCEIIAKIRKKYRKMDADPNNVSGEVAIKAEDANASISSEITVQNRTVLDKMMLRVCSISIFFFHHFPALPLFHLPSSFCLYHFHDRAHQPNASLRARRFQTTCGTPQTCRRSGENFDEIVEVSAVSTVGLID